MKEGRKEREKWKNVIWKRDEEQNEEYQEGKKAVEENETDDTKKKNEEVDVRMIEGRKETGN